MIVNEDRNITRTMVPNLGGNNVPKNGYYTSVEPPSYWLRVYNYMARDNGTYAVGWTPINDFTFSWQGVPTGLMNPAVSPNPMFYSLLQGIMEKNEFALTKVLMDTYGVRYFVVDNTSIASNFNYYSFFSKSPGLRLFYSNPPNIWVYEDVNASLFVNPQKMIVHYNSSVNPLFLEWAFYKTFGTEPVVADGAIGGINTVMGGTQSNQDSILYLNSENLSGYIPLSSFTNKLSRSFFPAGSTAAIGNGWVATQFNTGNIISVTNGTMSMTTSNGSDLHGGDILVSYLNPLFPNTIDIPVPNFNNTEVLVNWSFEYRSAANTTALSTGIAANNYLLDSMGGPSFTLNKSANWTRVRETAELPVGSRTFTIQIGATYNGTMEIRNLTARYTLLRHITAVQPVVKTVQISQGKYEVALYLYGNGTYKIGNNPTQNINYAGPHLVLLNLTELSPSLLNLKFLNVSLSYVGIFPYCFLNVFKIYKNTGIFGGYSELTGTIYLKATDGGYIVLPPYGWKVAGGKYIGDNSLGQHIYYISRQQSYAISIPLAFEMNISVFLFIFSFYGCVSYIFLVRSDKIKKLPRRNRVFSK
ncbi:MAG: hypothetical protein JRN15_14245 [Nitrososphaerota archaeon]|nr:hypothetical protein [Nitrososphaerota archaeon]